MTIEFFNGVFVIVVVSLIAQGWTIAPLANFLKLKDPAVPAEELEADVET